MSSSSYDSIASLLEIRPLTEKVRCEYERSRFGTPFSVTLELLEREIKHLRPRMAILEVDIRPQDFRLDGFPRANASATTPVVILTLVKAKYGKDIRYAVGTYDIWQDNVRAIALSLEALRKVDRYGVTKRGEQYEGFRALPAGKGDSSMTIAEASTWFRDQGFEPDKSSYRRLAARLHPDTETGSREMWDKLETAAGLLNIT